MVAWPLVCHGGRLVAADLFFLLTQYAFYTYLAHNTDDDDKEESHKPGKDKERKRKYVDISCEEATCWAYGALRAKDRPNEEYGPPRKFVGVLRNVWREY